MSLQLNKVTLAGNLTRDPELRYTPKGTAIAKLGIATTRTFKTESGEKKEEATFIDVDVFGRQAETIGQYLKKGRPVYIEGRLKLDSWDDKQTGQKRSKLCVVLENFQFLGGRPEGESSASEQQRQAPQQEAPKEPPAELPPGADKDDDSDIPF